MYFDHDFVRLPEIIQVNSNTGRYYKTPEKKHYSSITTILSKTSDMTGLNRWRSDIGPEVADHIMRESGRIGTMVHEMCEEYLMNKNVEFRKSLLSQAHFRKLVPGLDRINNIRGLEVGLYSDEYEMAGTADCIAEYDGELSVIDFKTSRSKLVERYDKVQKYFIQATAYSIMWKERTGQDIRQIVILGSDEIGDTVEFIKDPQVYKEDLFKRLEDFRKL